MKRYNIPVYPTKDIVDRDRSVLKSIPQRWKSNAPIGVILSGLLVLPLSGCDYGRTAGVPEPIMNLLTEDEARLVIMDEAKKAGINFELTDKEIKDVDMLFKDTYNKDGKKKDSNAPITLKLDGYDEDNKIAFEFVSENDFNEWTNSAKEQGKLEYCNFDGEVVSKNLKEAANRNKEDIIVGTFYNSIDAGNIEDSKEMLRTQVIEFIEWLKSEGII